MLHSSAVGAVRHSGGVAWLFILLCMWLAVLTPGQSVPLPSLTSEYYTMVTAGFDSLLFSQHFEEYGNANTDFYLTIGRYYSPTTVEYNDAQLNRYYLRTTLPGYLWETCTQYYLQDVTSNRLLQGSTWVLKNMSASGISFTNLGLTTSVRLQPTIHYSAQINWSWSPGVNVTAQYLGIDSFIKSAYGTANVSTSTAYSVSITVDVYLAADSRGTLLGAGGGSIPVEYTITGSRSDSAGQRTLNIVYDFMHWAALDYYTAYWALRPPYYYYSYYYDYCGVLAHGNMPPAVPSGMLQPVNTTLPILTAGGRLSLELTASNHPPVQVDALLKSAHGQELLIFVADPNTYNFYSLLFEYSFQDERDFAFANGAVYTLNGTDANPYNEFDYDWQQPRFCTGTTINPNTVSPIQWINAGSVNTIFANPKFFSGARSSGRSSIRGIQVDAFSVDKVLAYNGAIYDFTVTMFLTANGWSNLGRTMMPSLGPQIVRFAYSGTRTPAMGSPTSYTMKMDFYLQYVQSWYDWSQTFNPQRYYCPSVVPSQPILPPLPPQYTVTVSEAWYQSSSSSQYTVYADSTKGVRRIDGRFTSPSSFSILTNNPLNNDFLNVVEWSQNVTLSLGFSSLTLQQNLPFTHYQPNLAPSCGTVTLSAFDFTGAATMNVFDWIQATDPSQAVYVKSVNQRGVDLDIYQVSMHTEEYGRFVVATFQVYYLAADENLINAIPVSAEVSVQFYNTYYFYSPSAHYEFFNFRSSVPQGVFDAPGSSSCTGVPSLPEPVPVPPYYTDPNPNLDGTNRTSPVWPSVFSLLLEGQFFTSIGDNNIYVARWYADFANLRERLDIEPAFNMTPAGGVNPVTVSYIYYYTNNSGNFAYNDGIVVTYNASGCGFTSINGATINPLKQVPPGNLFDPFFPQTSFKWSNSSIYNIWPRYDWLRFDGFFYDEYDWTVKTSYAGQSYQLTQSIFVSIKEWINNGEAQNFSNSRIPLGIQATGQVTSQTGVTSAYNALFRASHYQARNPGPSIFDAQMLGCPTTSSSPWFNVSGTVLQGGASSSGSSMNTSAIVGAVVGVVGGLLFVLAVFAGLRWWKKGMSPLFAKYAGGMRSRSGNDNTGTGVSNELVGVGKVASDADGPENSLNRASLNNLVKEGDAHLEVHEENTNTTSADE